MRLLDARILLLVSAVALAPTAAPAAEKAARPGNDARSSGRCVIVDYQVKRDASAYTWHYCPSSRVFVGNGQRWITNFDTGMETRVLDQERKVRMMPIRVKQEQQRAEIARRSALSVTATGKSDVIAGIAADEYLFSMTYGGTPMEVHQWFAKDLPTPGWKEARASNIDTEMAGKVPPGVFLRSEDREATNVRKGEPPESVLAIPADYQKQHWSTEKKDWVDGE